MELVTGGAQVEAAAHVARRIFLDLVAEIREPAEPTVSAERIESLAHRGLSTLSTALGLRHDMPRRPLPDEQMLELARDEQHIDEIAGRAA